MRHICITLFSQWPLAILASTFKVMKMKVWMHEAPIDQKTTLCRRNLSLSCCQDTNRQEEWWEVQKVQIAQTSILVNCHMSVKFLRERFLRLWTGVIAWVTLLWKIKQLVGHVGHLQQQEPWKLLIILQQVTDLTHLLNKRNTIGEFCDMISLKALGLVQRFSILNVWWTRYMSFLTFSYVIWSPLKRPSFEPFQIACLLPDRQSASLNLICYGYWYLTCWPFERMRSAGKKLLFSEQQLMDCSWDHGLNKACDGGDYDAAMDYLKELGGVIGEDQYEYLGADAFCKDKNISANSLTDFEVKCRIFNCQMQWTCFPFTNILTRIASLTQSHCLTKWMGRFIREHLLLRKVLNLSVMK